MLFKDFIAQQASADVLKQGSVSWLLPPALVDAFKVEGFFRLQTARRLPSVLPMPDESYQVGIYTLSIKATEVGADVRLLMWADAGPYRRTMV